MGNRSQARTNVNGVFVSFSLGTKRKSPTPQRDFVILQPMTKINIDLGPSAVDLLIEKWFKLFDAKSQISREMDATAKAIDVLGGHDQLKAARGKMSFPVEAPSGFNGETTEIYALPLGPAQEYRWRQRITNLLVVERRFLRAKDIIAILYPLSTGKERADLVIRASNALFSIVNSKKPPIKTYINDKPKTYWYGLAEWFDEQGGVRPEYLKTIDTRAT